jgi:DNA-binding NarL/FixJ family response regulator
MNNEQQEPVTVLIGDDHSIVIEAVAMQLTGQGCKIIGKAKTVEDVIAKYSELMPDVLVLDIKFSGKRTGLDVANEILEKHPDAKIVFLSQNDQDALIRETYKLGGHAFLTKDCDPSELATAVLRAHKGELYFMPGTAEQLASALLRGDPGTPASPLAQLDTREVEIFTLMAQGFTNEEIGERLSLSKRTISISSQHIKDKLNLHRPAEITRLAVRLGLIEP